MKALIIVLVNLMKFFSDNSVMRRKCAPIIAMHCTSAGDLICSAPAWRSPDHRHMEDSHRTLLLLPLVSTAITTAHNTLLLYCTSLTRL